ncbi:hypothetical protein CRUP_003549 [Coryphaenoides rupestris]|nr:hypothetical protein CRUP_003549 [Coryphaenoides rupestris]
METSVSKSEQTSTPTTKYQPDERVDAEGKKPASRATSRRLENYMGNNYGEEATRANAKPCTATPSAHTNSSPVSDTSPSASVVNKVTSPVATVTLKPTFPATNASYKSSGVTTTTESAHKPSSPDQTPAAGSGYKQQRSSGDGVGSPAARGEGHARLSGGLPSRDQKHNSMPLAGSFHGPRARLSDGGSGVVGGHVGQSPSSTRDKPLGTESLLGSRGVVRAELVVVQNESSSDSEGNSDEDNTEDAVFEEFKASQRPKLSAASAVNAVSADNINGWPTAAREEVKETRTSQEKAEVRRISAAQEKEEKKKKKISEQLRQEASSRSAEEDGVEEDEGGEEEGEQEERAGVRRDVDRVSPTVFCGIENAAFVDDRDIDQILRDDLEEEEEEEDEEDGHPGEEEYGEYCAEAPGLSDEEEPPARRKIKFSTSPILALNQAVISGCGMAPPSPPCNEARQGVLGEGLRSRLTWREGNTARQQQLCDL